MDAIIKMQKLLDIWKHRKHTINGKIQVVNCLAINNLLYLYPGICTPPSVFQETRKVNQEFLWNGKPWRISYDTLIQSKAYGGLGIIDLDIEK